MNSDQTEFEEEIRRAIALLHSVKKDSTEKLRKMLEIALERKSGGVLYDYDKINETRYEENMNEEECLSEEEEIPIISIPDEGTSDGAVCRVCKDSKLGPLILIECQDCQETYHPLCHSPAIIDTNVHDPRFVWRCSSCCAKLNSPCVETESDPRKSPEKSQSKISLEQNIKETSKKFKAEEPTRTAINFHGGPQLLPSRKRTSESLLKSCTFKKRVGSKWTGRI
ncbi:integrator complex subunit 12-like [Prorops nasuta]|uniref:integrator complex subunit 12-like n=1 Tax=Prorops nasuta TaxID=863751 RepID=UPI0034CD7DDB